MHIHIKTDVISIRAYADGCSYHNRDEYIGIVTGYILPGKEVYLVGASGNVGTKIVATVLRELKAQGFKSVSMERHGKVKKINL